MALKLAAYFILAVLVAGSLGCVSGDNNSKEALAKCLASKGAKMYGAYWCPHCQNQKSEFGDSFKYIDYTECDPSGPNPNPGACRAAGIQGYPTWIIGGTQYPGEMTLEKLGEVSGCSVPNTISN